LVAFAKVHRKKIVIGVFEIIVRKIGVILIGYGSGDGQESTGKAAWDAKALHSFTVTSHTVGTAKRGIKSL